MIDNIRGVLNHVNQAQLIARVMEMPEANADELRTNIIDHLLQLKEILTDMIHKRAIVDRIMHESKFMIKKSEESVI